MPDLRTNCPACNASDARVFFRLDQVPVLCNQLHDTPEGARSAVRGDIVLAVCRNCALVYNAAFDTALMDYNATYENALHHSPTFVDFADRLARRIAAGTDLRGKTILEVGCGDAWMLIRICAETGARGVGLDPAADPHAVAQAAREAGVEVTATAEHAGAGLPEADLVLCRHVLEHISDPVPFVRRFAVGRAADARVYIETPDAAWSFRDLGVWDVLYEHCLYLTEASTRVILRRAGLEPRWIDSLYGGQFLGSLSSPMAAPDADASDPDGGAALEGLCERFGAAHRALVERWRERLDGLRREGGGAVIWGAGSKGVMFLNAVDPMGELVSAAVDRNPKKLGRCVAGVGATIIAPADLTGLQPGLIIVMNPLYLEEIRREAAALAVRADVECV